MAYTFVKAVSNSVNNPVVSFTPVAQGSLIIVISDTSAGTGNPTASISDNTASSWKTGVATTSFNTGTRFLTYFYLPNCSASISQITLAYAGATPPGSINIGILEYSGISPSGGAQIVASTFTAQATPGVLPDAIISPVINVTNRSALIFGISLNNNGHTSASAGSGYVGRDTGGSDFQSHGWVMEDKRVTTTGNVTATYNDSAHGASDTYINLVAAFLEAPLVGRNSPIAGGTNSSVAGNTIFSNVPSSDIALNTGVVGSLNMYVTAKGLANTIYLGLYDSTGNQLCAGSVALSVGLNTINFASGPLVTAGQQYHLVYEADATALSPTDNGLTFKRQILQTNTGALPSTITFPGSNTGGGLVSIWADIYGGVSTYNLTADTTSYSVLAEPAVLASNAGAFTLALGSASYTYTANSNTLVAGGNFLLLAAPASYDLIGGLSTTDLQLDVDTSIYALSGQVVSFSSTGLVSYSLSLAGATYTLTGQAASIGQSQQFTLIADTTFYATFAGDSLGSISGGGVAVIPAPGQVLNLNIVADAFQKIGIIDESQAPSAEQGANGLQILNDYMLWQARDGMRLGWFTQTDLSAIAPLRNEDVWAVKTMLAAQLAIHYGITIQDANLVRAITEAERTLAKRTLRYMESDLSELSRPQGSAFGGPGWN